MKQQRRICAVSWWEIMENDPKRAVDELNALGNVLVRMGIDRENKEEMSEELRSIACEAYEEIGTAAAAIFDAELAVRRALRKARRA